MLVVYANRNIGTDSYGLLFVVERGVWRNLKASEYKDNLESYCLHVKAALLLFKFKITSQKWTFFKKRAGKK